MKRRLLSFSAMLAIGASLALAGHLRSVASAADTAPASTVIRTAPAFTTSDLTTLPTDNWITNGGTLSNQRFSPLTEITAANVAQLKGVWMTHLNGGPLPAKFSAEAQPIEYAGVLYVPTGMDDVYAVSVDTGAVLWKYQAHLDQTQSTVCCGWLSRGVAIGDGKVYIGQLDGKLVALDQTTGNVVWTRQVESWQEGYSLTAAPLYINGMVITGMAGGEYKIRGRVTAFNATTGEEMWRFYTVPGPGEIGHETWSQTNDAWQHGGASVWQTPSVDPKLGLLYFTTGNASPDDDASARPGKNLFSVSMVALNVKTGKIKWYYQMVHHDIWDYDAPSPTVIFDATIGGKTVHGIGEAAKTGWLYLLDRETGKPIFPIPERPVPQDPNQKSWPTQPIPSMRPLVNQIPTAEQVAKVAKAAGKPVTMIVSKQMYTPYWHTMTVVAPGPAGGTNWSPSSYSPQTHMFYVCAQNGIAGMTADTQPPATTSPSATAPHDVGSLWTVGGGLNNPGVFSAVDALTGKIVWQKQFPDSCYSGSTVTAGNVVFVGRNGGELQAYNAKNGTLLWAFQTGAGANNVATIFRRANGHEALAFYAGGNALAATPHGDNLWLFGLDGTLDPVAPPGTGQGIQHAGEAPTPSPAPLKAADASNGATVFGANCSICHGANGLGGNGGPNLATIPAAKNMASVMAQVTNGGGGMPPFKASLTPQQIEDVSSYVVNTIAHGK